MKFILWPILSLLLWVLYLKVMSLLQISLWFFVPLTYILIYFDKRAPIIDGHPLFSREGAALIAFIGTIFVTFTYSLFFLN